MLRPLFLKAAGRSMALTNQPCNRLARKRSENVSGSPMSSTKLSSHSSRNAKLRPNWKTKLSSFRRRSKGSRRRFADSSFINAVSFSFACTMKRFPSSRCASQLAQFTIKTNLKQSEEFEGNHDNDYYSYYVEDVSAHAGDFIKLGLRWPRFI